MAFYVIAAKMAMQIIGGASAAKSASQQNIAQNKMIQKYNEKTMYSTMEQVTQINMQRAQQRQETAAALFNVGLQGQSARDQITTQAAATDTIGASVSDAISTVNQKQSQAAGSAQDQYMRAIDQSNLMLQRTIDNGSNSMKGAVKDNSTAIMNQAGWSAAGTALGGIASSMLGSGTSAGDSAGGAAAAKTGSYDYQGYNPSPVGGDNPFGLKFSFDTNTSLSGN